MLKAMGMSIEDRWRRPTSKRVRKFQRESEAILTADDPEQALDGWIRRHNAKWPKLLNAPAEDEYVSS